MFRTFGLFTLIISLFVVMVQVIKLSYATVIIIANLIVKLLNLLFPALSK